MRAESVHKSMRAAKDAARTAQRRREEHILAEISTQGLLHLTYPLADTPAQVPTNPTVYWPEERSPQISYLDKREEDLPAAMLRETAQHDGLIYPPHRIDALTTYAAWLSSMVSGAARLPWATDELTTMVDAFVTKDACRDLGHVPTLAEVLTAAHLIRYRYHQLVRWSANHPWTIYSNDEDVQLLWPSIKIADLQDCVPLSLLHFTLSPWVTKALIRRIVRKSRCTLEAAQGYRLTDRALCNIIDGRDAMPDNIELQLKDIAIWTTRAMIDSADGRLRCTKLDVCMIPNRCALAYVSYLWKVCPHYG
ncbi:hypothetical protein E5Q_05999 [Mixia osmundae IAM 14324]|uniref:Uncharacterized protein n=1 Tax=Mixia osmundae (strain CBS 9802 / IAM 14324 / JCM 22182 / KY 12970) TaxID=764103 RepID=G7E9I5_MIXOS|nr:hypothetical protein E5Q_05999 [Mixia osmundae IAM 14324]